MSTALHTCAPQEQDFISKMVPTPIKNALCLKVKFSNMNPEYIFL